MDNFPHLFFAYTLLWLTAIGYIFSLLWKEKNLRQEIDNLKKALREEPPKG